MNPTYEQLACLTRLFTYESNQEGLFLAKKGEDVFITDGEININLYPAVAYVNVNDLWYWGTADCEQIKWEHMLLFEKGLMDLEEKYFNLKLENWDKLYPIYELACKFFSIAYVAAKRGSDPENYFKYYKHEDKKYTKINEEDLALFNEQKAWWIKELK